jgi:hypothetical protein
MAFAHIHFDQSTQYGALVRAMLRANESADDQLLDVRDLLIQMRDGDGSQNIHYANVVKRLKVADYDPTQGAPTDPQNAVARALFEEIDSAFSKTSGNGSVTNVRAARDQLYAKTRG